MDWYQLGIDAQCSLVGSERFLNPVEASKRISLAFVGSSVVRLKTERLLTGLQGLLIPIGLNMLLAFVKPLVSRFLHQQSLDRSTDAFRHIREGFVTIGPTGDRQGIGWQYLELTERSILPVHRTDNDGNDAAGPRLVFSECPLHFNAIAVVRSHEVRAD